MGFIIHDSFSQKYRSPLGAVRAGQPVRIALRIQCYENASARLIIYDNSGAREISMTQDAGEFSAVIETSSSGVLRYNFFVQTEGECGYYCPKSGRTGGLGELFETNAGRFQLTVYERDFHTPDFFKGALMYQIFPDRFASSGKYAQSGREFHEAKGRRVYIHDSFDEEVLYEPHGGSTDYAPDDYFLGDFSGIESKLDYLAGLGVEVIYLNPIFEAASNHRYNTSDYMQIDPFLGTNEDFSHLCIEAKKRGIKIILDGVFSHTGSDSVYFKGALTGQDSPYYSWYTFLSFPDDYKSWWGFKTLPEINKNDPSWQDFIINAQDSVIKHWLKAGAAGYRLDVADELPDEIIFKMRDAVKGESDENLLLGEVWEDATTKLSYGKLREYALGDGLDSVMNYPLRSALIAFLKGETTSRGLLMFLHEQQQNYPMDMYYCLMNLLSSHDVERMRTVLSLDMDTSNLSREQQAKIKITDEQDKKGAFLLKIALAAVMTLPGMPSIYYGDECGMHGLKDPFDRRPYKQTDISMIKYCAKWGEIHKKAAIKRGYFTSLFIDDDALAIIRFLTDTDALGNAACGDCIVTVIDRSRQKREVCLDLHSAKNGISLEKMQEFKRAGYFSAIDLLSGEKYDVTDGLLQLDLDGRGAYCMELKRGETK